MGAGLPGLGAAAPRPRAEPPRLTAHALWSAAATTVLAVGLAVVGLRLPPGSAAARRRPPWATLWLERLHIGHVGDQVAWLVGGAATLAFALAAA